MIFSVLLLVSSCGSGATDNYGNPQSYTVGGTVSNLFVGKIQDGWAMSGGRPITLNTCRYI